ncbi:Peptidoglycan D,D-transpeptidase MrdA [bacterium HR34]|nr:Peptidoglycan D,D-transpeptidase MrdA [bacterium HR34]
MFEGKNKKFYDVSDDFFANRNLDIEESVGSSLNISLKRQAIILISVSIFVFLFFAGKILFTQIVKGSEFENVSLQNAFMEKKLKANRGVIYDRNMNQLAFNDIQFNLVLNLENYNLSEIKNEIYNISKVIDLDSDEESLLKVIEDAKNNGKDKFILKENLPYENVLSFYALPYDFKFVSLERDVKRFYENGPYFSHIIGYTSKITLEEWKENKDIYDIYDVVGRAGVEKVYEEYLRSSPGKIVYKRDARNNAIGKVVEQPPSPGSSVVLTIDKNLQEFIFDSLEKQVKDKKADGGVVIVMKPKTGEILSLVSYPSYDNNIFSKGTFQDIESLFNDKSRPMFNRAISGIGFPTGSTIKPFIGVAGLAEGIVNEFTKFDTSSGKIIVRNPYNKDIVYEFHDWQPHGLVDIRKAIAVSSNIYFYIVGGGYKDFKGLGVEKVKSWLEKFGFSKKTQIDLTSEGEGFIPYPEWKKDKLKENWYIGDTYNLSIGQGYFSATPIELITAYSGIANDGYIVKPRVVKEIINSETKEVVRTFEPEILYSNLAEKRIFRIIKEGMRQSVEYGTATFLNDLPVKVGAKTGTAQIGIKTEAGEDIIHSWIVTFYPYDNPEIIIIAMLENVRGKGLGPTVIAKEVLEKIINENLKF